MEGHFDALFNMVPENVREQLVMAKEASQEQQGTEESPLASNKDLEVACPESGMAIRRSGGVRRVK